MQTEISGNFLFHTFFFYFTYFVFCVFVRVSLTAVRISKTELPGNIISPAVRNLTPGQHLKFSVVLRQVYLYNLEMILTFISMFIFISITLSAYLSPALFVFSFFLKVRCPVARKFYSFLPPLSYLYVLFLLVSYLFI